MYTILKLLQSYHFAHIPKVKKGFWDLRNLKKSLDTVAHIKGMLQIFGRWSKQSSEKIYLGVEFCIILMQDKIETGRGNDLKNQVGIWCIGIEE